MMRLAISFGVITALAGPAVAQDWDVSAAIYGWGPATALTVDTPLGEVNADLSFSEAWDALDFAFMGTVSADRGRLGFVVDTVFLGLSDSAATAAVPVLDTVDVESQLSITSLYATWQIFANGSGRLDVGGGLRYYVTDSDVTLNTVAGPRSFSIGDDWVDPLIALRYRTDLGPNWYATLFADVGGFGVGSEQTWQALAMVGYRINDNLSVEAGYRTLNSERDKDNGQIDVGMSGPALGLRWRF